MIQQVILLILNIWFWNRINICNLLLLGGGGLANYTPSKVDLASEVFELGVTRASAISSASPQSTTPTLQQHHQLEQQANKTAADCFKPSEDPGTWGQETAADMLYWMIKYIYSSCPTTRFAAFFSFPTYTFIKTSVYRAPIEFLFN